MGDPQPLPALSPKHPRGESVSLGRRGRPRERATMAPRYGPGCEMEPSTKGDFVIETHALTKRYGDLVAVDAPTDARPSLRGLWLPGTERRREDHDAPDAPRPGPADRREHCSPRRAAGVVRGARSSRGTDRVPGFYPFLSGRDNLRVMAAHAGVDAGRAGVVLDEGSGSATAPASSPLDPPPAIRDPLHLVLKQPPLPSGDATPAATSHGAGL